MATVPATPRTNLITLASPGAGPYDVGFRMFEADAIDVFVDGVRSTDWTMATNFVDGYDDAATITFGSSLPTSTEIFIDGAMTPAREDDYVNPDPGLTGKLNIELARIAAQLSELNMKIGRTLRGFTDIDPQSVDLSDIGNLATYAAEAEAARDEVVAIQATLPEWQGAWVTATAYVFGDLVQESGSTYICLVAHTSGTFNTDLAAARWGVFAAKGTSGSGTGDVIAANNGSEYTATAATFRANVGLTIGAHVQAFNQLLAAIAGLGSNGIIARLSGSTAAARTLSAGAGLAWTDGDGVAGNPTINLSFASQAEAEAGTESTKPMNSLRVAQAIARQASVRRLLGTSSPSGVAATAITAFDNAIYTYYEIVLRRLLPSVDGTWLALRTSTDGGASYDAGASDYSRDYLTLAAGATSAAGVATIAAIALTDPALGIGTAAGEQGVTGSIFIRNCRASEKCIVQGDLEYWRDTGVLARVFSSGARLALQDTDAVRLFFNGSNIASGDIEFYGHI